MISILVLMSDAYGMPLALLSSSPGVSRINHTGVMVKDKQGTCVTFFFL